MSKIPLVLLSLIGILFFCIPESFADDMAVYQYCEDSIVTVIVFDENTEPIKNVRVNIYDDKRAVSGFIDTVKTDKNGMVQFSYSENTRGINVSKGGFNDVRFNLVCDDVLEVEDVVVVENTDYCKILIESEFGNLAIYGSEQQKALSDPACRDYISMIHTPTNLKLETPSIPHWISDIALWYGQGIISDSEFIESIRYLIDNQIILLQNDDDDVTLPSTKHDKITEKLSFCEEVTQNMIKSLIVFQNTVDDPVYSDISKSSFDEYIESRSNWHSNDCLDINYPSLNRYLDLAGLEIHYEERY